MDWLKGRRLEDAQRDRAHHVFTQMANFASVSGAIGTMIGLILMLRNLSDPSAIGPAMAVALLCLLYAIVMGELVFRAARPTTSFRVRPGPIRLAPGLAFDKILWKSTE